LVYYTINKSEFGIIILNIYFWKWVNIFFFWN